VALKHVSFQKFLIGKVRDSVSSSLRIVFLGQVSEHLTTCFQFHTPYSGEMAGEPEWRTEENANNFERSGASTMWDTKPV